MRCIEARRPAHAFGAPGALQALALVLFLVGALLPGCSSKSPPSSPATGGATPRAVPAPVAPPFGALSLAPLAAPQAARSWAEFQLQAARRLVAANPGGTYLTAVPDPLLAIPVLEVELNEDGQVRRIKVRRVPTQATDTVQLAKDAVQRAAPYGSMRHLGKPWTFVEVFLFDDERRFKPRTLDD